MSHLYLLGVASLTLTSAGFAGSDMNADLQNRLEAAEARIAELSADQNKNWLNDERADAVRGLVQDVLADADTRASLQGASGSAGYDGGFTIASADGSMSLKINGGVWTSWTSVDDETDGADDSSGDVDGDTDDDGTDTDGGFNAPDTWIHLSGTIAGDFSYNIRHDGDTPNGEWANVSWNLSDGWDLTMGSFNLHQHRSSQISAVNQMLVGHDRNAQLGNGLSVAYTGDDMRFWAEMTNSHNGEGTDNDGDYNTNLRFEYMAEGNWGQFDQWTSADGGAAGTLIGFGYRTLSNDNVEAADFVGDEDIDRVDATDGDAWWNLDIQMQFGGYAIYVGYTDFSDDTSGAANADWDQTDIMGSYYMNSDWELYVAYSDRSDQDGETLSVGVNNYWAGQNAKWTTQYTIDESDDSGDVDTISTQLQFYF
jgi:hypothetical protein